jgi:anti-sigma B factor antagonist
MKNLSITERSKGSVVILDLKGQIKLGEGNIRLHNAILDLVAKGTKNVVLNLESVSSIDSSGLGEIIASHVTLKKNHGALKLLGLTKRVRELMVITKLLTVLDCFKTEADAVSSFRIFFDKVEKAAAAPAPGYQGL